MVWRRPGDKPSSEPMMVNLLTHICAQWYHWCAAVVVIYCLVLHVILVMQKLYISDYAITHLLGMFLTLDSFRILNWTWYHRLFLHKIHIHNWDVLQERALQLFSSWCLVPWTNNFHLDVSPPHWKPRFKRQLVCKFDMIVLPLFICINAYFNYFSWYKNIV